MQRDKKIDAMRGFAALLVMWVHIPIAERRIDVFVSTMMLPVFFWVAGYVLKAEDLSVRNYIKQRWIKLFLSWVVISYAQAYLNISEIKRIFAEPARIVEIAVECTEKVLKGQTVWFVPTLLVALLIVYLIIRICKDNVRKAVVISGILVLLSDVIMKIYGSITFWNLSAALTNQGLILLGYYMKHSKIFELKKWNKYWIVVHSVVVCILMMCGYSGFDVRQNLYQSIILLYLICASGIYAVVTLASKLSYSRFLVFMGQHSLLYFAFGPHGYKIGRLVLNKVASIIHLELTNCFWETLFICIVSSIAWVIPALIIDIVCPVLNGKFTWPIFSKNLFLKNLEQVKRTIKM